MPPDTKATVTRLSKHRDWDDVLPIETKDEDKIPRYRDRPASPQWDRVGEAKSRLSSQPDWGTGTVGAAYTYDEKTGATEDLPTSANPATSYPGKIYLEGWLGGSAVVQAFGGPVALRTERGAARIEVVRVDATRYLIAPSGMDLNVEGPWIRVIEAGGDAGEGRVILIQGEITSRDDLPEDEKKDDHLAARLDGRAIVTLQTSRDGRSGDLLPRAQLLRLLGVQDTAEDNNFRSSGRTENL